MTIVSSLALAACAHEVQPSRENLIGSESGIQIAMPPGTCGQPSIDRNTSIKVNFLTVVVNGKARPNPTFEFLKPGIPENLAARARAATDGFKSLMREACSEFGKAPPEKKGDMLSFHRKAAVAMVETAIRFESLSTAVEIEEELSRAHERCDALSAQAPFPRYAWGGAGKLLSGC